ncbi:hypothetical protein [Streptomyces sp. MUM 178J]|uniref:hypothetical protein n=1 Tax=Streptomyces sp. MUM 178J TaxID=2791991 RepID=UPI001F049BA2|nr:hypothetical protein [Streptomyces sp. MUM 178J]WRQ80850.1 hypothetical protein I3F59_016625 [Streptomyces sp. MUM 178J]
MPLIPEEPQIHESAQGPRATPAAGRTAPTPRPVPGPRSAASPRPGHPGPGPARPTPPQRTHSNAGKPRQPQQENRSLPQIQLIPASADGALDAAGEAVDLLLDSGRSPGDLLVFTTGEQHPWAAHELSFGEAAYWAQHDAGDDVFYADAALADRAATRPVVVVAVNSGPDDAAGQALPAALKKAAALLIVCGDPKRINAVLAAGV